MEGFPEVRLVPLRDRDVPRLMTLSDDPELIEGMGWQPFVPGEEERFRRFTEVVTLPGVLSGENRVFSILAGDVLIGYTALRGIGAPDAPVEVGIAVMEKGYRGRGYGAAALRRVIDYAFLERNVERLGLTVLESNRRAIRTYEQLGFHTVRLLRDAWELPDGTAADLRLMELRRPAW